MKSKSCLSCFSSHRCFHHCVYRGGKRGPERRLQPRERWRRGSVPDQVEGLVLHPQHVGEHGLSDAAKGQGTKETGQLQKEAGRAEFMVRIFCLFIKSVFAIRHFFPSIFTVNSVLVCRLRRASPEDVEFHNCQQELTFDLSKQFQFVERVIGKNSSLNAAAFVWLCSGYFI